MADTNKPANISTKPKLTVAELHNQLDTVEKKILAFSGKPGHNPYMWIGENVYPLRALLNKTSPDLEALSFRIKNLIYADLSGKTIS